MEKVICNIPHAGTQLPPWAHSDFSIDSSSLDALVEFMVDKNVDRLFDFVSSENKVVASLSRIVLDMERFRDDADEPMAKIGMGLFYTKDPLGNTIRSQRSSYDLCLSLYDAYHAELESKTTKCLEENGNCFILDCHSFHDKMTYTGYHPSDFPDICIGFNGSIPPHEVYWIRDLFESNGYQVKMNVPFSGSLVPIRYFGDSRVQSIMIELNRRIYCHSMADFEKCRSLCKTVYDYLNSH